MDSLKCVVNENLERDLPEFDFKLIFENDFFNDEYDLESEGNIPTHNRVKYDII